MLDKTQVIATYMNSLSLSKPLDNLKQIPFWRLLMVMKRRDKVRILATGETAEYTGDISNYLTYPMITKYWFKIGEDKYIQLKKEEFRTLEDIRKNGK
jgi:hypothetical protein